MFRVRKCGNDTDKVVTGLEEVLVEYCTVLPGAQDCSTMAISMDKKADGSYALQRDSHTDLTCRHLQKDSDMQNWLITEKVREEKEKR